MRFNRALQHAVVAVWIGCSGCAPGAPSAADVRAKLTFTPAPPAVGIAAVALMLADSSGSPLTDAKVRLEGNMNHAGMKPSFADLQEVEPGRYAGTLAFTMGGDWFVLVTIEKPDGNIVEKQIEVPGVRTS